MAMEVGTETFPVGRCQTYFPPFLIANASCSPSLSSQAVEKSSLLATGRDLSKISKQRNVIQNIGNILYEDANNLLLCLFCHVAGMWSMRL